MIERVVKADGAGRVPVGSLPDNIPASKIAGLSQGLRPHTVDTTEPASPNKGDLWTGSDKLTRYWDGSGWIVVQSQDPSASRGVSALSTSLQLANDTIANHARTLNTLSNSSTSAAASITTLQSEITQLKSSINVATTDIANIEKSLTTLTTTSGTHTTNIAALMAAKDVTTNSLDTLNTSVSGLTTRVTTVETKVASIESSIGSGTSLPALTSRMSTAEGEIDTLQSNATALTTRVASAETAATALTGRVGAAETTIASNTTVATTAQAKAGANETALTALAGRVTTAENDIDTLETNVTNLTTTVNGLSNNASNASGGMPVYKAEKYGTVNSDQADCAAPIQAAIDAAATAGGGIVTLPAGQTLKVSTLELKTGVTLDGLTRKTTLRQVDYTDNHLIRITAANVERAKVTRLTINGRKGAQNAANVGVYHENNSGSQGRYTQNIIEDVDITSTKGPAIRLGVYSTGNVIRDVRIYDCANVGIQVVSEESLVENVYVGSCAAGGILVQKDSNTFRDVIVEACGATGAAPSVKVEAQNASFDGLHVMKSQGHDVMVHKTSTVIKGLRISNALLEGGNGAGNGSVALWLQDTAGAQVQATVQKIVGHTPSHAQALYLYGSTAKTCNVALSVNDGITPLKGVTNPADNHIVVNGQTPRPAASVMWSAATDTRPTADTSVMVIFTGAKPPANALAHDLHIVQ